MSTRKSSLLALVLTIGLAAPASAQSIPFAIPDITSGFSPITFTNWSGMGVWQQVTNGWTQLTNEAKNLFSIGTIQRNAISSINSMMNPPTAELPNVATNATEATLTQAPLSAQTIQMINADAKASEGAHSDSQVTNSYLSAIATGQEEANIQQAQIVQQEQSEAQTKEAGLGVLFDGRGW